MPQIGVYLRKLPRKGDGFALVKCLGDRTPWYLRPLALVIAGVLLYVVGGVLQPGHRPVHPAALNHVSLAFDRGLTTLVSYNGGGAPGLNPETLAQLVHHRGLASACTACPSVPLHLS